ncbi:MAG: DUF3501 family protein [Acidiferrobacterales bacterium]|jgi:hypothetical protein|nr:DUF3501 family protein [Acidiferrobacterales bacterium]
MQKTSETIMKKLTRDDLWSLEEYAQKRGEFRAQVMAHKKDRQVHVGPNATLYFEDRMVMQYQIQEMLRVERIFEAEGIQEELDAYNPMIPDGCNWKATFMIEYDDVEERREALAKMVGIEDVTWVQVADFDRVFAIADEDLERETEEKTSSVHFLRFELTPPMAKAVKDGASVSVGIDHESYRHAVEPLPANIRDSLAADLD